jgi:hypothetical protein
MLVSAAFVHESQPYTSEILYMYISDANTLDATQSTT